MKEEREEIKETLLNFSRALLTHKEGILEQKEKLLKIEESLKRAEEDLGKNGIDTSVNGIDIHRLQREIKAERGRIDILYSRRRYDKAQFFTNVVLILLLLVYIANEVVKLLS